MSIFDFLADAAPVAAEGTRGYTHGQREREQQEQQREKAIRDEMWRQAVLARQERMTELAEKREDRLSQPPEPEAPYDPATDDVLLREEERRKRGLGQYAPTSEAERRPTPGQQFTERAREEGRVKEEALGNALTWASSGQIERSRGIQLLAKQHNLSVGTASTIWDTAVQRLTMQEGRGLMNEGRELRLAGGDEDPFLAELRNQGVEIGEGGGPRNPLASGRAVAAPADTGQQYAPDAPQLNPDFAAQIDADLQAGKSPQEIIADIQAAGLPPAMLQQAEAYLRRKGGGGL